MEKPVTLYVRRREGRAVRWDRATHDDILVQPIVARLRADLAARDAEIARLRDVVAAERGDNWPAGWMKKGWGYLHTPTDAEPWDGHAEHTVAGWRWSVRILRREAAGWTQVREAGRGVVPLAIDAVEAADRAAKETT